MRIHDLVETNQTRMVLLVLDGLGGIPHPEYGGKTELEAAQTPHLDALAERSALGLHQMAVGLTPGSGPAHMALFGYDPFQHVIGRGVLEALGLGIQLEPGDVALRGNFATLDEEGRVVDRRAGRIATDEARGLLSRLHEAIPRVEDVDVLWVPGKEHRFALVLRGPGLSEAVRDTDPQKTGVPPGDPEALDAGAEKTARILMEVVRRAREVLGSHAHANGILLRGASQLPHLETLKERWGVQAMGLATYPMYRGIAQLVGMVTPYVETFEEALDKLKQAWKDFDFFFLHYKDPDKKGEDGDFEGKVKAIEALDALLPAILDLGPTVLMVTGDHATPSLYRAHSWHPVPVLLHGPFAGADGLSPFSERTCRQGSLGRLATGVLMRLIMANAGRIRKYGA